MKKTKEPILPKMENLTLRDLPEAFLSSEPDKLKTARDALKAAENFFKHADRDPDDIHELKPEWTEVVLLDACRMYRRLTGEANAKLAAYHCWWLASHPEFIRADLIEGDPVADDVIDTVRFVAMRAATTLSKAEFYDQFLAASPGILTTP